MSEKTLCPIMSKAPMATECRENCALFLVDKCIFHGVNQALWELNDRMKEIFKAMERARAMGT